MQEPCEYIGRRKRMKVRGSRMKNRRRFMMVVKFYYIKHPEAIYI